MVPPVEKSALADALDDERTAHSSLTAEQSELLMDVAMGFGSTLDLDTLLPMILTRVTTILCSERALFALMDDQGNITRATTHNMHWEGPGHSLPISQQLMHQVRDTGAPVVVSDTAQDIEYRHHESVRLLGLRFIVGLPVSSRDRMLGVLYSDSRSAGGRAARGEKALLNALARLMGTAVENARFFEGMRYRMRLLTHMVHDFRTPLSVAKANLQLLGQGATTHPDTPEMLGDLEGSVDRMIKSELASKSRVFF